MNKFDLLIVVRRANTLIAKSVTEDLLMELTAKTDATVIYNENESWGQFQYWTIETTLNRLEINTIAHQILNDFTDDDDRPWWAAGHHPRRIRRYHIVRVSVYDR